MTQPVALMTTDRPALADKGTRTFHYVIQNIDDIVSVYGHGLAGRVLVEVAARADLAFANRSWPAVIEAWGVTLVCYDFDDGVDDWTMLESSLVAICGDAIVVGGHAVFVSLTLLEMSNIARLATSRQRGRMVNAFEFRGDMCVAASIYRALARSGIYFSEGRVTASDGGADLYRPLLPHVVYGDGHEIADRQVNARDFIVALDRVGLTRVFDRIVVLAAIDRLRHHPEETLGCSISALSAIDDVWWHSTLVILSAQPAIAARLIVEIERLHLLAHPEPVALFAAALRARGCRVAIGDFDGTAAALALARDGVIDLIKIDAGRGTDGRPATRRADVNALIRQASHLQAAVVAANVENETDFAEVLAAGARWVHGPFIG
ncbi:EAL domain-containing protein (putative c-di-GMP-specific phosphodiesterase class I) [Rhizobium sp. PP-CC-3A-592]|nr:EAL domain-containing protein (putative c-di-GMP-specific phosphodiesterase class I) [Rhizobium sp. PP-CC-3A-592]